MRYLESRERSGELLRLILPVMGAQQAGFHPVSYTLWYEHVAGVNAPLSEVLSARAQPLTDDEAYELYARFVIARDRERLQRLQDKLRTLLEEVARATSSASGDADKFKSVLERSSQKVSVQVTLESVQAIVDELTQATLHMHAATRQLAQNLEVKATQVGLLSEQLELAQSEALLDPLTGLKNRRAFMRALEQCLMHTAQDAAVLLIDVDHFKQVNDSYGHLLGDKVLCAISQIIEANIKGRDLAARIGGDEFIVLLRNITRPGAVTLAEQLRTAIASWRIERDGHLLGGAITVSIGVVLLAGGESAEGPLARADRTLYQAKHAGRNRIVVDAAE